MAANPTNDLAETVVAEAYRLQEFLTSLDAIYGRATALVRDGPSKT